MIVNIYICRPTKRTCWSTIPITLHGYGKINQMGTMGMHVKVQESMKSCKHYMHMMHKQNVKFKPHAKGVDIMQFQDFTQSYSP